MNHWTKAELIDIITRIDTRPYITVGNPTNRVLSYNNFLKTYTKNNLKNLMLRRKVGAHPLSGRWAADGLSMNVPYNVFLSLQNKEYLKGYVRRLIRVRNHRPRRPGVQVGVSVGKSMNNTFFQGRPITGINPFFIGRRAIDEIITQKRAGEVIKQKTGGKVNFTRPAGMQNGTALNMSGNHLPHGPISSAQAHKYYAKNRKRRTTQEYPARWFIIER